MKNPVPWLAVLLTLWIAGASYVYRGYHCIKVPLAVTDNTNLIAAAEEGFTFPFSGDTPTIPAKVEPELMKIVAYLNDNPDKYLNLVGKYQEIEKNTTTYDNLGIGRAEAIKTFLVQKGVGANRIATTGEASPILITNGETVYGGVGFKFTAPPAKTEVEEKVSAIEDKYKEQPIIFYFAAQNLSTLTPEQLEVLEDLTFYLKEKNNAKIRITGHTDSQGQDADNLELGERRANIIKDYFTKNEIASEQINATSKGESKPRATNETPEGRIQNRRVEIFFE